MNNKLVKIGEIILIFVVAFGFIKMFAPFAGDNIVYKQIVIWFANILMLFYVWLGIKLRDQKLSDFGITFNKISIKKGIQIFLISILVFIAAIAAFVLGSIIMANITGIPESPDMSNYTFLQNNLELLFLTLIGTYIVASFGEEVIYRGFIINRLIELGLDSKFGKVIVIFISALIFGLAHYQWGLMGIVQTGFMGAVLGFFYLKLKKRIWILVLAHGYMDTILLIQMYMSAN
ncbi:CPBP family intramembrane glutamic endopeptidase [Aestuariivivens sp. NBU2969]|uniref:CPBP family intramembrane glutamic endopeptidase n=1 Tax=Aestuariivivens sp. NBU2969 TaxID=2873267 RepID=UPI001CBECBCB|nr:type II CAAX endopeptidase family protein [Aestuariivivens sp. NBU2969]